MGGFSGDVVGTTKIATWLAFKQEFRHLLSREAQEERGMYLEFPRNKRSAYRAMKRLPDGSGWRLHYHFHS